MSIFDPLATAVAVVLELIHNSLSQVLPSDGGWAWGLSVVLLTITVRVSLLPLAFKQMRSQRRMQEIAPKIKDLQKRHKGDRETLNTELMKVYKDHGANPVSGCLPMLVQLPIFFALFKVMNEFRPNAEANYGLSEEFIRQGAAAKVFGAPISASLNSASSLLTELGSNPMNVRVVAALMVIAMGATSFFSMRQMMLRNGGALGPQQGDVQAQAQKLMLYLLPLSFAVSGFIFPIGVLLYWLTTNVWSMAQQQWMIRRFPPPGTEDKASPPRVDRRAPVDKNAERREDAPRGSSVAAHSRSARPSRAATGRTAGHRKQKRRKGGRR